MNLPVALEPFQVGKDLTTVTVYTSSIPSRVRSSSLQLTSAITASSPDAQLKTRKWVAPVVARVSERNFVRGCED